MFRNALQKRLRIECLEEKIALAANLTVDVIDGDLVITGDAEPNSFLLEKTFNELDGQFRIVNRGPLGDTINGDTNQEYFVSGVTRDIVINLGEGDDKARIYGFPLIDGSLDLNVPRDLVINADGGNDQIYLGITEDFDFGTTFSGPVNVGRDLTINGGAGDEIVWTTDINVGDDLTLVDTQGSIDYQNLFGFEFLSGDRSYVADNYSVVTGSGNDVVGVVDTVVGGNVSLSLGGGDDLGVVLVSEIGGGVAMSLGAGFNEAQIEQLTVGGGVGVVGSGTNNIFVAGVTANTVTVVTGSANDSVQFFSVTAGMATIATFGGADSVSLTDSAFDLLMVHLGAGSDELTLQNVDVSVLALLIGGGGTDTFNDLGDNDLNLLLDLGFEIFN
ncbi:MAG: hypothetical protein SH868_06050 [Bythopirellula sp.]|nr:hypothetical protein [Bythopirellula sp.]